jgi:hypothetical protein
MVVLCSQIGFFSRAAGAACYFRFKMDPLSAGFWTRPIGLILTPPNPLYHAISAGYGVACGN